MGKLRPETVEWLASGHAESPSAPQAPPLPEPPALPVGPAELCFGAQCSVGSRRVDPVGVLDPLLQLLRAGRICAQPALPVDCPPGAVPFRDLQCALYNGRPVLGTQKIYQWVPFYGAPSQCDLNCLAEGHTFYHSFGRVLDGTACSPGAQGVCVAGRCLSAGCDGLLGSGALEDRCGRCGGANDSCLFVQRVFRDAALMGGDGRYILNGDWAVSPPGTYEAAGTHVVYTRGPGPEETLHAAGPTSDDLLLQVLLQEPNPGIEFEFWLPRERYNPFQARAQALGWPLRQPQPREVEPQPPAAPAVSPAQTSPLAPDPCPPCPDTRGRAHRLLHYCASDFVTVDPEVPPDPQPLFWQRGHGDFRRVEPAVSSAPTLPTAFQARVLGRHRQAQETRYEVRIQLVYKNRTPLRAREYVWAPGRCPCPMLAPHRDYLLAVQRLVSPDGTQDRLLLPHAGYARPWSPAEDSRIRLTARRCPV
ncbi:ADAMTS-like protein 5 isoform X6 [Callithrix jacchus]